MIKKYRYIAKKDCILICKSIVPRSRFSTISTNTIICVDDEFDFFDNNYDFEKVEELNYE